MFLVILYFRVGLLLVGDIEMTPHVASYQQSTWHENFPTEIRVLILAHNMYVKLVPIPTWETYTFAKSLLPIFDNIRNFVTMVNLEGPPPHSAAVSLAKVSHYHCGQVGCCFGLRIVLCWRCFVISSALTPIFNCFRNFVMMGDLEPPAAFSGCLTRRGKSLPLRSGWLLFWAVDRALFALFCGFFCFSIVIVVVACIQLC